MYLEPLDNRTFGFKTSDFVPKRCVSSRGVLCILTDKQTPGKFMEFLLRLVKMTVGIGTRHLAQKLGEFHPICPLTISSYIPSICHISQSSKQIFCPSRRTICRKAKTSLPKSIKSTKGSEDCSTKRYPTKERRTPTIQTIRRS